MTEGRKDLCLNEPRPLGTISRRLELTPCPLRLGEDRHLAVDCCGDEAVGIALEMLRLYRRGELDSGRIIPPTRLLKRVAGSLHPLPSPAANCWTEISKRQRLSCDFCNVFSSWSKQKLSVHTIQCKKRLIKD